MNEKEKELNAMRVPPSAGGGGSSVPLHTTVDWAFWKKLSEVKVFEAIALLHGSEPASQPPDPGDASPEYRKTLRLLLASMSDSSTFTPCTLNVGDAALNGIRLFEVGKWAMANGYMLPGEFPRPVQVSKAPAPITPLRGNGYSPSRMPSSANWNKWKHIPKVELWKAVCLTLDVEPDEEVLGMDNWLKYRKGVPRGLTADFAERLFIAQENMSANGPIRPTKLYTGVLKNPHAEVSLAEVAAAAVVWEWAVPNQMAGLANCPPDAEMEAIQPSPANEAGMVPTSFVHSTKSRRDALTPVIELAQTQCRNPVDTAEVWAALLVLAEKQSPPLRGATEEGIQYLNSGSAEIFKRDSLRKRLAR